MNYQERTEEVERKFTTPWVPHPHTVMKYIEEQVKEAYETGLHDGRFMMKNPSFRKHRDIFITSSTEQAIEAGIQSESALSTLYLKEHGWKQ